MVNSRSSLGSAILLGTLGVLSFIVQPAEVEGLTIDLGLSDAAANGLVGYEMAGIALATVAIALIAHRANWRVLLAGSLALGAVGDLASAAWTHSAWLGGLRALSGLGHGGIISLSFTFIGLTDRVERNLAIYLAVLLTYGAFGILAMPWIVHHMHFSGLFLIFGATTALGFVTLPFVPASSKARQMPNPSARQLSAPMLVTALAAVLFYNFAMGALWANLTLIGTRSGLPEAGVDNALAISQFTAIAGALTFMVLAGRFGRNFLIVSGIGVSVACIAALIGAHGLAMYMLAVCVLNFAWNFVQPFILAIVGDFDTKDRMISAAVALQMIGLGLGPIVSSELIETMGYHFIEALCIACLITSYIQLMFPMKQHHKELVCFEVV